MVFYSANGVFLLMSLSLGWCFLIFRVNKLLSINLLYNCDLNVYLAGCNSKI